MKLQVWTNARRENYLIEMDETNTVTFASGPKTKLDVAYAIACIDGNAWKEPHGKTQMDLAHMLNQERKHFAVAWEQL